MVVYTAEKREGVEREREREGERESERDEGRETQMGFGSTTER